jgi:MarR family transcriptional regulator, lower aerobic nicotinate degradation pathway regulator
MGGFVNVGRANEYNCRPGTLLGMETAEDQRCTSPALVRTKPSWLLNQAAIPANRLVADGLARVEARRYHYVLLAALDEAGPASQAELSRRTTIDRSDIVAAVNELAERDLVERAPDPTDRRRNVITLTTAGRRYLRNLDKLLAKVQDDLLAPLSPDERHQLVDLLTRVVDHHARPRASDG